MTGPRGYSAGTRAALAQLSRGSCYNPECTRSIITFVDGEPYVDYQIAHIRDASPGNRYVADMTDNERRSFANLVLLCKPCHTLVDKAYPENFSIELLEGWKRARERTALQELAELGSLDEAALALLVRAAVRAATANTEGPALLGLSTGFRPSYEPMLRAFEELHGQLQEREVEVDELCRRVEAGGYVIVEGDAYAGKTALMTHLASRLNERGCRVVRFYVVEDSDASPTVFLRAVIVQLLELLGEGGGVASDREGQVMQFQALWQHALATGSARLVMLVDGLDEQDPLDSISRVLPQMGPPQTTVVVSTRPNPDLADGVGAHHPLARAMASARYALSPSPHAHASQRDARAGITSYLKHTEPARVDLVGFLTFARGLLSTDELATLIGISPGACERLLDGLRRHLKTVHDHDTAPRYAFGHIELERQAKAWFGASGETFYAERIIAWGRDYEAQCWPLNTPWYLIRSLDDLVNESCAPAERLPALLELATDERARLLRARLGHQQPMFDTIDVAISLLRQQDPPDLDAIFRLAVVESDSRVMSPLVPTAVLVALSVTGRVELSVELARAITDDVARAVALGVVAAALAQQQPNRALEMARSISVDGPRAKALADIAVAQRRPDIADEAFELARSLPRDGRWCGAVAAALAESNPDRALALALSISEEWWMANTLQEIAAGMVQYDPSRALEVARSITIEAQRAKALSRLSSVLRRPDIADEALEVARSITDESQPEALGEVGAALAKHDPDVAMELANSITGDAERARVIEEVAVGLAKDDPERALGLSRSIAHGAIRAKVVGTIASAIAAIDADRAVDIARSIADDWWRAKTLADVAGALGRPDIADEALEVARSMMPLGGRSLTLAAVVPALAQLDPRRALEVARSITVDGARAQALADVAAVVAGDDPDEALEIAQSIPQDSRATTASALASVARSLAQSNPDRALIVARSIADDGGRARALAELAAAQHRPEIVDEALGLARSIADTWAQAQALAGVVGFIVRDDPDRALAVARSITNDWWKARTLVDLANELHRPVIVDEALAVARSVIDDTWRASAMAEIAAVLARHDPDRALDLAGSVDDDGVALGGVAAVIARHDPDRALELARSISHDAVRDKVTGAAAESLAQRDPERALMLARSITVEGWRARALVCVARRLGAKALLCLARSEDGEGDASSAANEPVGETVDPVRSSDFFISYAQPDLAWAEWIAWELEAVGHQVVLQSWDFRAGSDFVARMQDTLATSARVLAVLSPAYVESGFAMAEWRASFALDPEGRSQRLLPVRVANFRPPESARHPDLC